MNILYVDDESSAHTIFQCSLGEYAPICHVTYLTDYEAAMEHARCNSVDCAFLDVSLLEKDGITLARDLRSLQPEMEFVFVTGYDEFARAAYEVGGRAYLTKPYSQEALHQALALMQRLTQSWNQGSKPGYCGQSHVFMRTFGAFDVLVDGVPVHFKNTKVKELLAYLIHQMGATVSNTQIFYALWDRQTYTRDNSTYVRRTIRMLKIQLEELGIGDVLISQRNSTCLDIQKISCDAYGLLEGRGEIADHFNGAYMIQYPWAQSGLQRLQRAAGKLTEAPLHDLRALEQN